MLNRSAFKTGLIQLLEDMSTRDENSIEEYSERFTTLLENFNKSGKAKAGIQVSVAGPGGTYAGVTTVDGEIY